MPSNKRYTPPTHIRIAAAQARTIGISEEIFIGLLFVVIRRIYAHIQHTLYTDVEEDINMFARNQTYYDTLDIAENLELIVAALTNIETAALPIIEHVITDICIDREGRYIYMRFY